MARSLQDRLRDVQARGHVTPEPVVVPEPDPDAEPSLDPGPEPLPGSLKARLQALIDQQTRRRNRPADVEDQPFYEMDSADPGHVDPRAVPLGGLLDEYGLSGPPEDLTKLIDGEVVSSAHGDFLRRDAVFSFRSKVGRISLQKLVDALPDAARILTASLDLDGFDPRNAAFIDTETTGISGGAGTAAFLVAVGFIEAESFIVRQYFMRDFHEERALIRAVERDLERFDTIVSFNGKQFDVPLLESRFRLQRRVFRQTSRHLDMLHPGRRLWKARLESCSLQSLERGVLGFHREDDIPGAFIPGRYFEYLRRKDGRLMVPVMEHNLQDIVSLAALTGEALEMVATAGSLPEDALDVLSLGRVLERADLDGRSEEAYRAIAENGVGRARVDATVRLAYRAKAKKDHDEAERLWRIAVGLASVVAHRELAMLLEHTRKNKVEALRIVDEGLDLVNGRSDLASLEDDLLKRRARLARARTSGRTS